VLQPRVADFYLGHHAPALPYVLIQNIDAPLLLNDQSLLSFTDVGADEATSCADGVVFEGVGIKVWEFVNGALSEICCCAVIKMQCPLVGKILQTFI
jgi:hypothetical protein